LPSTVKQTDILVPAGNGVKEPASPLGDDPSSTESADTEGDDAVLGSSEPLGVTLRGTERSPRVL
jgi:hypothetical protein